MILGIDTTTDQLVVGIADKAKRKIVDSPARPHSQSLLPLIERLLEGKKPDAIVVTTGPGSYTGTRVGVVTANTLAWTWRIPVWGLIKNEKWSMKIMLEKGQALLDSGTTGKQVLPVYPKLHP